MGKGMVEGCASCCKWLLIIFNVLFCLIGVGMIAAGVYAYIVLRDYLALFENQNINAPAIVLIVFGAITFIIAAIGCIGACKESHCLLFTFAGIITILLIAEVVAGIVAFVYRGNIKDWLEENIPNLVENYGKKTEDGEDNAVTQAVNAVQKEFNCCGINGISDWTGNPTAIASCGSITKGCLDAIYDKLSANVIIVGGVGVGLGVLQILGIAFACCVGCAARKAEYA